MDLLSDHLPAGTSNDVPMDIVDIEDDSRMISTTQQSPSKATEVTASDPTYNRGYSIDVCFEASKLPLDVAIFNSARAAGDEKIRKYLQALLVIGGGSGIPGISHALESRLAVLFPCDIAPSVDISRLHRQTASNYHSYNTKHGKGTDHPPPKRCGCPRPSLERRCCLGEDGRCIRTMGDRI